jgi:type II secretory pathway pseudopilin PulG
MNLRRTRGITLPELLVTGVMTGILSTSLGLMLVNFSRSAIKNVSTSDVQGDVQGAVSYINTDLRQARYIYRQNGVACPANVYCTAWLRQGSLGFEAGDIALITDAGASGNSGSDISIDNLVNKTNAKIELAFWIRSTKSTEPGCSPFSTLPQGEFLAVPIAKLNNAPFNESSATGSSSICNLVAYGSASSVPAYKFVVYYTTTPTSTFKGPRVLYRWESGPVPIPFDDFGYSGSNIPSSIPASSQSKNKSLNAAATNVWVLTPPALGAGAAVSDYLAAANSIRIANSPTNPQSVTVSVQGSADNVQTDADAATKAKTATQLLFSATTYARNICSPGVACPVDPQ